MAPKKHRTGTRLVAAALVAAAAAFFSGAAAEPAAAVDRLNCRGYGQARVFLESQSWWLRTPGRDGTSTGHVHSGACFPYLKNLRGKFRLDVRSLIHANRGGRIRHVRVQAFNNAYGTKTLRDVDTIRRCRSGMCTFWTRMYANTGRLPNDGLTEFRIHTEVEDRDGSRNLATNGFLAYVRNGRPIRNTEHLAPHRTEGRGWYETVNGVEFGYQSARLRSKVPTRAVSGIWRPTVETLEGVGGENITRSLVTIDPDFHAAPAQRGRVLVARSGEVQRRLWINTHKLTNGKHRLVVVASARLRVGSTLSGVVVIPFRVRN
jgi:hypothetical protein